ncbi:Ribulose-5-phosphate 4-epimerase and related epimerases and aldolases [Sphingobacterium spiritivorum]|uniref:Ribulose-5-phosphate 4-epimerase and related epimerases and aldolases n=2 Tax=Sphingobacterium spiritivorum TaxID=258 RepID=A0A380C2P4_SPHSI|nr:Ribulose-5-phosphate 4-epimerase and related epimerases and aldolases [Sphingobacterium spiritivorum]
MIMLLITITGCYNRDRKIDKEKLLGKDYRLFQNTPVWNLAKAVEDENINLINQLVTENKLPVDYQESKFGNTLLMLAIENSDYESVKALLDLGANPNIADNYRGSTPMHDAAMNSDPKYLQLLIAHRGNPNVIENKPITEDDQGRGTPLNKAISYSSGNNLEKVKLLVDAGADINYSNDGNPFYTRLPLAATIIHERFDIALYLLEKGAKYDGIMYRTVQGDSIYILGALRQCIVDLDSKEYRQKLEVISFLRSRGLDYSQEPVPAYILRDIKKKYPDSWEEYVKKY